MALGREQHWIGSKGKAGEDLQNFNEGEGKRTMVSVLVESKVGKETHLVN